MVKYRIKVKNSAGDFIGEFTVYRNLNFGKRLNNYGTASFEIPVKDSKTASLISPRRYTVWIYREEDGVSNLVWAGEQALRKAVLDDKKNNWAEIICYTWFEQLSNRFTEATRRYFQVDQGEIAWDLIDRTQRFIDEFEEATFGSNDPDDPYDNTEADDGPGSVGPAFNFYQSFETTLPAIVRQISLPFVKDDLPVIGTMRVSLYTDNAGEPGVELEDSIKDLSSDLIPDGAPHTWLTILYENDDVQLAENSIYWLKFEWTPAAENNGWMRWPIRSNTWNEHPVWSEDEQVMDEMNGDDEIFQFYIVLDVPVEDSTNQTFGITRGSIEITTDRDRTYNNQNIMQAIINLSNVLSGFDFEITDEKVFNVANVIGTDLTDSIKLKYGLNVKSCTVTDDFTDPINRAIVLGEATDESTLQRVDRNDTDLQDLYKVRENVQSEMDVSEIETLQDKGDAMIRKYGTPLSSITVDIAASTVKVIDFSNGDLIRAIIKSGIFDIDEEYRIFEWELKFDEKNAENLSVILGRFTI